MRTIAYLPDKMLSDLVRMLSLLTRSHRPERSPIHVIQVGCSNGRLLKQLKTATADAAVVGGQSLEFAGIEEDEACVATARRVLAGHSINIYPCCGRSPQDIASCLQRHGLDERADKVFMHVGQGERASLPLWFHGSVPDRTAATTDQLTASFEAWAAVAGGLGIILAEVCHENGTATADRYLMAAAGAGLFPRRAHSKAYAVYGTSTITGAAASLNWYEKRDYRIRHPDPEDLAACDAIETACWPAPLRTPHSALRERIENDPHGQCVLEKEEKVVGVVY
jgi:hypothetical protein